MDFFVQLFVIQAQSKTGISSLPTYAELIVRTAKLQFSGGVISEREVEFAEGADICFVEDDGKETLNRRWKLQLSGGGVDLHLYKSVPEKKLQNQPLTRSGTCFSLNSHRFLCPQTLVSIGGSARAQGAGDGSSCVAGGRSALLFS